MEVNVEQVGTNIWNTISDFWQLEILRIGQNENSIVVTVGLLILIIVSLIATKFILKILYRLITRKFSHDEKLRFTGVFNFLSYFVYLLVFLSILSSSGIDLTLILTATAVLFIGLGLAMRELFQDIIGGIYIIMDKSVLAGDIVEIQGDVGRVFDIKLRTSRIITREDKVIVVPNHKFITDVVYNHTQNFKRIRECVKVRVPLDSDVTLAKKILLQSLENNNEILTTPEPFVLLKKFGKYAIHLRLHFFIEDSFREPAITSSVRYKIVELFKENNLNIALPRLKINE